MKLLNKIKLREEKKAKFFINILLYFRLQEKLVILIHILSRQRFHEILVDLSSKGHEPLPTACY